jgi:hypothetical protein
LLLIDGTPIFTPIITFIFSAIFTAGRVGGIMELRAAFAG